MDGIPADRIFVVFCRRARFSIPIRNAKCLADPGGEARELSPLPSFNANPASLSAIGFAGVGTMLISIAMRVIWTFTGFSVGGAAGLLPGWVDAGFGGSDRADRKLV